MKKLLLVIAATLSIGCSHWFGDCSECGDCAAGCCLSGECDNTECVCECKK